MADFGECLRSAMRQGFKMSEDEAEDLIARYEQHRQEHAAAGARDPDSAAKAALIAEKEQEAATKAAVARGQAAAQGRIKKFMQDFRDLDDKANVFEAAVGLLESKAGGTTSWRYRAEAHAFIAMASVHEFLSNFQRNLLTGGRGFKQPRIENVGREMLGEGTGSAEAKGMATAMNDAIEDLRQKFNKAAGFEAIGKLDGGYLPQHHSARALLGKPGRTAAEKFKFWFDRELPRLDLDKMRDPLTGGPLTPERLEKGMRAAWDNIVTGGWSSREPSAAATGAGALAKQRSEHRFIHYKGFDNWNASNNEFGDGDVTKSIFQHIRNMAHDIAAMETFGPNPNATVNWMKQVIESEAAKQLIGQPSLLAGKATEDTGKRLANRVQAIYDAVRGTEVISGRLAAGFGDVSNVLTSAYLGATSILAATTDPFIDRSARALNGLPATKALVGIVHAMRSSQTREQMVRSGLGLDDFLHVMGNEARYAGILGGHQWSQWLADRTVTLNGLNALTQARKHRFGSDWQAMAADHVGDTWEQLGQNNAYFRRAMENYGFTEKDWNALRKTELHIPRDGSAGFLQPVDVKNKDLGVRYLSMILAETERAVPTQTARSRSIVTGNLQRGTVFGEIMNSGLQFKSFTFSFTAAQWQAMKMELHQGAARGAGYAAALFIPLTLGGAMAVQINNVINGKDLQPMDPSTGHGFKFWLQSMFKGGGLGLLGDFLFDDVTRYGHSPVEQLSGPTLGLVSDALSLTVGNVQKLATGKPTHFGREVVKKAGRNVPLLSTHPFTRAAYQRMVIDQLQYATDPEAHKYFRDQQKKMKRETGQSYFWPPGATSPERPPQLSTATK